MNVERLGCFLMADEYSALSAGRDITHNVNIKYTAFSMEYMRVEHNRTDRRADQGRWRLPQLQSGDLFAHECRSHQGQNCRPQSTQRRAFQTATQNTQGTQCRRVDSRRQRPPGGASSSWWTQPRLHHLEVNASMMLSYYVWEVQTRPMSEGRNIALPEKATQVLKQYSTMNAATPIRHQGGSRNPPGGGTKTPITNEMYITALKDSNRFTILHACSVECSSQVLTPKG